VYGRIMIGIFVAVVCHEAQYVGALWLGSSLMSFNKHNMWSYYGWVYRCFAR